MTIPHFIIDYFCKLLFFVLIKTILTIYSCSPPKTNLISFPDNISQLITPMLVLVCKLRWVHMKRAIWDKVGKYRSLGQIRSSGNLIRKTFQSFEHHQFFNLFRKCRLKLLNKDLYAERIEKKKTMRIVRTTLKLLKPFK